MVDDDESARDAAARLAPPSLFRRRKRRTKDIGPAQDTATETAAAPLVEEPEGPPPEGMDAPSEVDVETPRDDDVEADEADATDEPDTDVAELTADDEPDVEVSAEDDVDGIDDVEPDDVEPDDVEPDDVEPDEVALDEPDNQAPGDDELYEDEPGDLSELNDQAPDEDDVPEPHVAAAEPLPEPPVSAPAAVAPAFPAVAPPPPPTSAPIEAPSDADPVLHGQLEQAPPREPWLTGRLAAVVTGLAVGLVVVALTIGGGRLCTTVKGTSSCGGPGYFLLILILVVAVLIGSALLRSAQVADPGSTSFLAVGLLSVLTLIFLVGSIFSWWMVIAIPLFSLASFTASHWITTSLIAPDDDEPALVATEQDQHDLR